jgi:pimeloyl-ACP methyl ester carboxylesterase
VIETDLALSDGRTLHVYDTVADGAEARLTVFWHHGTPNVGAPPEPLLPASAERGVRWVSFDRPGYGGSTPRPGRDVASAADDVASVADALGIAQFAVMGHSGGGPHALACAALLQGRVVATVCGSGLAPFDASDLDWYAGMGRFGAGQLRAAAAGRGPLEPYLATTEFDPDQFTPADHAALAGEWSWVGAVAALALEGGRGAMVDDNLAFVARWGFDPGRISTPILYLYGAQDRVVPSSHGEWLARRSSSTELWLHPEDGHISVLRLGIPALDWLLERTGRQ